MGTRIDPNARFDRVEKEQTQKARADAEEAKQAMKRRFASQGLSGSGAAIKVDRQVDRETGERLDNVRGQVANMREGEALRRQEVEDQRTFQSSEAQKGRDFVAGESGLQRAFMRDESGLQRSFMRDERLGSQGFAASEAGKQRDFSAEMRQKDEDFKTKISWRQDRQFNKQLRQQAAQFERQMSLDEENSEFNRVMAEKMFNKKGFHDRMLGGASDFWKDNVGGFFDGSGGVFGGQNPFSGGGISF